MFDTPKEKSEKAKALKKLMCKWLSVQATEQKANLLLTKNPDLKVPKHIKKKNSSPPLH